MTPGISRRRLIARGGGMGVALTGLPGLLAACGGVEGTDKKASTAPKPAPVSHPKTAIDEWTFANWPLYMDKKLLKEFDRRFGGHVKYVEEINDNFEFFGKVRQQLQQGSSIKRDLLVLTDPVVPRFVRADWLEPIDRANVPNAANLVENLATISYDPERRYTLPYQAATLGLGYNAEVTGREVRSMRDLFGSEFKGRTALFTDPYFSAPMVLLMNGKDPGKATVDDVLAAVETIAAANAKGQFRRFTGNDYTTDLVKGNVAVCLAWSGDIIQLQQDNPNLHFVYPDEGTVQVVDNLLMPKGAEHPYAAETFMNYLYDPEVAARLTKYIGYYSPVKGVREILSRTDPELADDPLIFPPDEVLRQTHLLPALTPAEERRVQEAMAAVTGA
jgi:spermidine/putrescine transport system substrate-binding protein